MSFSIEGRTAIVTGAGQELGLAVARRLLDHGARVMFADMDEAGLKAALAGLEGRPEVGRFHGDLRERLTLANLMSATIDRFDRVDILVNATRHWSGAVSDAVCDMDEMIEAQVRHNLMTTVRMTQLAAKRMIAQAAEATAGSSVSAILSGGAAPEAAPAGAIVNLGSIAAVRVQPPLIGDSVAAAALDQFTRAVAVQLAPHGIRVNAVATVPEPEGAPGELLSPARSVGQGPTLPRRAASPEEVAQTVHFLVSDAARALTGQVLIADGGRTLIDPVPAPAG
jgi:7-alpha-hydroxysteroid dehydrogenase